MSYMDNLRDERDQAISHVEQMRAQRDNCYDAVERLDAAHRDARAEADRLREAIEQHREDVAVFEGAEEDDAWSWHQALWAALDAEDGDGLTEVARISADADLYRKTDGAVIRREDGSA